MHAYSANGSLRRQLDAKVEHRNRSGLCEQQCSGRIATFNTGGHTISGNASVQRQIGEHLNLQLQYITSATELQRHRGDIQHPQTKIVWRLIISYQFSRPLGR